MAEDTITIYDAYGRELQVTKEVWKNEILPQHIIEAHNNPNELYNTIYFAFEDGFFDQVLEATERLIEIDFDYERSHVTRGVILAKLNKNQEAQEVFENYLKKYGESSDILYNYAKLFDSKEHQLDILERSLKLNQNQSHALEWYGNLKKETFGEDAYEKSLKKWAEFDQAWMPQFLLAQARLKKNKLEEAYKFFQEILSKTQNTSAILHISAELGTAGKVDELIAFIEPVYSVEIHGLPVGYNLLEAYLQKEDTLKGTALLEQFFKLQLKNHKKKLQEYAIKFFEKNKDNHEKKTIDTPEVSLYSLDKPIWYYGLNNPDWLFEEIPLKSKKRIGLFPLTKVADTEFGTGPEDNTGKISRSVVYFLQDASFLNTTISPIVMQAVAQNIGPAILTNKSSKEEIQNSLNSDKEFYELAISGTIEEQESEYKVTLDIWNFIEEEKDASMTCLIHKTKTDTSLFELRDKVYAYLIDNGYALIYHNQKEEFKTEETAKYCSSYPYRLNNLLSLVLINNNYSNADNLYLERAVYDGVFDLVANHQELSIPKIMAISAYINGQNYKSKVIDEYTSLIELILKTGYKIQKYEGMDPQDISKDISTHYLIPLLESPIYRLSPIVLVKLGKFDEARELIKTLKEKGNCSKQYFEWAAKILEPFEPKIPTTAALPEPEKPLNKENSEKKNQSSWVKKLKDKLQAIIIAFQ